MIREVRVPVCTVWSSPDAPRDVDAAAVSDQPDVVGWAASMGPDVLRLTMSYIDIKSTPSSALNPLDRPKELYTAVSTKISQYWRLGASHRHNLGPGGGAIRTDMLLQYEDECFATDLTIARDNTSDRDFRSGIQILLRFSLKTIGDLRVNTMVGRP